MYHRDLASCQRVEDLYLPGASSVDSWWTADPCQRSGTWRCESSQPATPPPPHCLVGTGRTGVTLPDWPSSWRTGHKYWNTDMRYWCRPAVCHTFLNIVFSQFCKKNQMQTNKLKIDMQMQMLSPRLRFRSKIQFFGCSWTLSYTVVCSRSSKCFCV